MWESDSPDLNDKPLNRPPIDDGASRPAAVRVATEDVTEEFTAAHAEIPVEEPSGGDFHAVFPMDDGSGDIGVIVGDIAGHGRTKTPQAEHARDLLADCLEIGLSPAQSLDAVNALLEPDPQFDGFGTAFVGRIESGTGTITYASGGHEPGLIAAESCGGGEPVQELKTTGPPLAIAPTGTVRYDEQQATLPEEGTMLLYTDGVSDARPPDDRSAWFGIARLKEELARLRHLPPARIVPTLLQTVIAFCRGRFHDDAALVAIRRHSHR